MTIHRATVPLLVLALIPGCGSMNSLYWTEVRTEQKKHPVASGEVLTEAHVAPLPDPVRQYLGWAGYVGRAVPLNAELEWRESAIRLGPDRPWMKLTTHQFNSVPEPMRAAHMRGRMLGVLSMEGRDIYQDGRGQMLIRLGRLFTVADDTGPEMDQAALVTILAEAVMVPGYAIQPYITWAQVDARTARATIRHRGAEAAGVFHFDADGAFTRFESDDRFQSAGNEAKRVRWSVDVLSYQDQDGLRIVDGIRSTWHPEEGDFEYFRGRIAAVRFNVADEP